MTPPLDDKELLLVTVYLERTALADLMVALPARGTHFIPLGELCHRLGFGIRVHPIQGTAEGFFISTHRTFKLDPSTGAALVEKKHIPFHPGQVELLKGELYVDVNLLPKWFPMGVEVESKGSALLLTPKETLPIQAQWAREQRYASMRGGAGVGQGEAEQVSGVPLPEPYRFLDLPMMDLHLNAIRQSSGGRTTGNGTLSLGGDVLWMSGLGTVNRDSAGNMTNSRMSLFRENPSGMAGFLGLKRINLGDLLTLPGLDVVGNLPVGRGLLLDNYPISYRSSFAKRAFRGPLPVGWSVELYHNGALLGFRRSGEDAGYEFADVPLRFGLNQFRLVFQGPLGERKEENFRYDISNELPAPGQVFYRLAGVRPHTGPNSGATPSGAPSQVGTDSLMSGMGELEVGVSRWMAMRAGYLSSSEGGQRKDYGVAGMTAMMPYLVTRLNAAIEKQPEAKARKGRAVDVQLLTGFGHATFSVRHSEYRQGFQPLQSAGFGGGAMKSQSEVTAQMPAGTLHLPFSTSLSHRAYTGTDGKRTAQDRVVLSQGFKAFSLSAGLSRDSGDAQVTPGTNANLMCSTYFGRFSAQAEAAYGKAQGTYQVQEWSSQVDYRDSRDILYRMRISGNVANKQSPGVSFSANRFLGRFAFGVNAQYSKSTGSSVGLNLGLSVGRDPRSSRWITTAQQLTGTGSLSVQAYRDSDGNGRRDPGEPFLEDAQFKLSGGILQSQIRDAKTTFLAGVGRSQELRLELDETSLPDGSLHAGVPCYRVLPRAGHVQKVDYPVVLLGEINGTTRLRRIGEPATDLGGLEIEVVTKGGHLIQRLRSAFDGFFEFLKLIPGDYVLRVTPDEVKRLGLKGAPERSFTIDAKRNLLDGLDLVIEAPAAPKRAGGDASGANVEASHALIPAPGSQGAGAAGAAPEATVGLLKEPGNRITTTTVDRGIPSAPPVPSPQSSARSAAKAPPLLPPPPKAPMVQLNALQGSPYGGRGSGARDVRACWTVVLLVADKDETVAKTLLALGSKAAIAFVRQCRNPKRSSQVCLGRFERMAEAKRAVLELPEALLSGGNRPYVLRMTSPMEGSAR